MTNWYLDAAVGSSGNGQSWATAWKASSNVVWGASGVKAGDTLYVATGSYARLVVGASGTTGNLITIRASQDTHTGVATFTGASASSALDTSGSYLVVNGEYGGSRNLTFVNGKLSDGGVSWIAGTDLSQSNIRLTYCNFDTGYDGLEFVWTNPVEVDHCSITGIIGDHAFYQYGSTQSWGGSGSFHHNTVQLTHYNSGANAGVGADGIQCLHGFDVYNNSFSSLPTNQGGNHQDYLQAQGQYVRFYNNDCLNSGDSGVDFDMFTSPYLLNHIHIYNNIFRYTEARASDWYPQSIRFYRSGGSIVSCNDLVISNNLWVDVGFSGILRFQDSVAGAMTNTLIQNNMAVNCGHLNPLQDIVAGTPSAADYNFDYNLAYGTYTNWMVDGVTPYNQAHAKSGLPTFTSYSVRSASNDFHLLVSDTAARGQGANLSAYFTTDRDGVTRPASGAWDLGPYQYAAGGSPPVGTPTLSVR
jgi:hypothetical protein